MTVTAAMATGESHDEWIMDVALRACAHVEDEYKTNWNDVILSFGSRMIPSLDTIVRQENDSLKKAALEYLRELHDPAGCAIAMDALAADGNFDIIAVALGAIAEIRCTRQVSDLIIIFQNCEQDTVRRELVKTLYALGTAEAYDFLFHYASIDRARIVWEAAFDVLTRLALEEDETENEQALDRLIELSNTDNPQKQMYVASRLEECFERDSYRTRIIRCLDSLRQDAKSDPRVVRHTHQILARLQEAPFSSETENPIRYRAALFRIRYKEPSLERILAEVRDYTSHLRETKQHRNELERDYLKERRPIVEREQSIRTEELTTLTGEIATLEQFYEPRIQELDVQIKDWEYVIRGLMDQAIETAAAMRKKRLSLLADAAVGNVLPDEIERQIKEITKRASFWERMQANIVHHKEEIFDIMTSIIAKFLAEKIH